MGYIGRNIKKIRNVKGLSQQSFADLFSLTRGNISSYEEQRADPKIDIVIQIANYFSIPLADFIQKDLSVNELLHYKSGIVLETEKLKVSEQLVAIPFIPVLYLDDYIRKHNNADFIHQLPHITVPCSSKVNLLAFEVGSQDSLPSGCNFSNGDILIFEQVTRENIHRIMEKMGFMIDSEDIKKGIYKQNGENISLVLNEWVNYTFDINTNNEYWVLRAFYSQL